MINSGMVVEEINRYLAILTYYVQTSNTQGRTDVNKDAENLFAGLLNLMYDCNLKNMNDVKANFPAIDLGDRQRRFCVQVTSVNTQQKIQQTLDKFFKYGLDREFSFLLILIIGSSDEKYRKFDIPESFHFTKEDNIWDIVRLAKEIGRLSPSKQEIILGYLERHLKTKVNTNKFQFDAWFHSLFTKKYSHSHLSAEEYYQIGRSQYNNYRRDTTNDSFYLSSATHNFQIAAEQGHVDAQYMLGLCHLASREPNDAIIWLLKAAENDHAEAQFQLGKLYYKGKGIARNYQNAAEWYHQAANQGHTDAQYELGLCYDAGEGVNHDPVKAVSWLHKAAAQGHAHAQCVIGLCYLKGNGVPQSYNNAVKWFQIAADNGHFLSRHLAWVFRIIRL